MSRGISTNRRVTSQVACLKSAGIDFIFRYYSSTTKQSEKRLTLKEAQAISAAGMTIGVVYEDKPDNPAYFSGLRGHQDGAAACNAALKLNQPPASAIYFAVDYDATLADIGGPILEYFKGVDLGIRDACGGVARYATGVYGSGATCDFIKTHCPFVKYTWLAESTGWLGSRTYTSWNVSQAIATASLCQFSSDGYEDNRANGEFGGFAVASGAPADAA